MQKYLYNFEQQSWREARQRYFDLFDLVQNIDWLVVGSRVKYIIKFLNSDLGVEEKIEFPAKHALSVLEKEIIDQFISGLNGIIRWFNQRSLSVAELRGGVEEFIRKNAQLSGQDRQQARHLFSDFHLTETELDKRLKLITAVIGGPRLVFPYSFEEFGRSVFEGVGEIDDERLLVTLIEAKYDDKNGYKFVKSVINFLAINTEKDEEKMNWEESLLLFLMLDLLYYRFSKLTAAERWFLLQNYFYKSIVCGLPVKKVLQDYLRDSNSISDYFVKCSELKNCLANNKENIPTDLSRGEKRSMNALLNNFISQVAGDELNGYKIEEFARNLYKKEEGGRDAFVSWLRESFSILLHINSADLINWEMEREIWPEERAEEDKIRLLFYVGFGGPIFHRVVDYLKNKESVVSLGVLLRALRDNIDLEDEKLVGRIFDMVKLLKENNFLEGNKELLEFHESDGRFHWNKEVLK
ncbi:hypothetical protein HZA42_01675 [Candidatus Peregrinibacteria bacterium]|nr:hypothetical protein [Candidatus Peregrinibacteria bacterium]